VQILVSSDVADATRQRAQGFLDQWATVTNGAVTGVLATTTNRMPPSFTISMVPANTVAVRVIPDPQSHGLCTLTQGGLGCNTGGPPRVQSPQLPGRSLTTLHAPDAGYITHELGHAYGLWHTRLPAGTSVSRPMMGPPLVLGEFGEISEVELQAITEMRAAGMRNGSTRGQAVARGLVNP
jgi:hypothetical protein